MRVQEKLYTTCAKMTEERGLNGGPEVVTSGSKRSFGPRENDGTPSPGATPPELDRNTTISGGRLKFFKDGKFILELSHRKEGDRMSWVPVPKKTYWPLSAAGTPRQESSTSLSVSDDNSSVQSSPWQRDHCWKQSAPQQGISKEMTFFMQAHQSVKEYRNLHFYSHDIRRKRRCPYEPIDISVMNSISVNTTKLTKVKKGGHSRAKLSVIVQTLLEKVSGPSGESLAGSSSNSSSSSGSVPSQVRTVNITSGRMDPSIISPRKRILREMERVSLDDSSSSKRRARTTSALSLNNNGSSSNCTVTCQTLQLSSVLPLPSQSSNKASVSSYSITSLLGTGQQNSLASGADYEPSFLRSLLRSSSQQATSPELSPRLRPGCGKGKVDGSRKASPPQGQQIPASSPTLSPSPDSHSCGLRTPVIPSIGSSSPHLNPFLGAPLLYPALNTPYLPHHPATPSISPHPYYSSLPPVPSYRGSSSPVSSLWVNYPLSSLPRGALYPGLVSPCHAPPLSPWNSASRQTVDNLKHEDSPSDVPLNLSKHAG
ncbi:hypothetical protein R5R35_004378 [Gryllus longicercus]|uniref:Hairless n=1 Tax=Gryllus longicercus TaxID=2509291 RepID=A0AAN9VI87_9ORTH